MNEKRNDSGPSKEQLRMKLQRMLLSVSNKKRAEKSKKACRNLVGTEQFKRASAVMMYLSLPHEVDTSDAILYAWQQGKMVAVPKISWQQRHMIPVEINSLETGFNTAVAGLRNPVTGMPVPFEEIELVVTPGLGFDRVGHRLGRGSSYYDRFFGNERLKAPRCGLGFTEQLIESIPVTELDVPMNFLVTDDEVIYCSEQIAKPG